MSAIVVVVLALVGLCACVNNGLTSSIRKSLTTRIHLAGYLFIFPLVYAVSDLSGLGVPNSRIGVVERPNQT